MSLSTIIEGKKLPPKIRIVTPDTYTVEYSAVCDKGDGIRYWGRNCYGIFESIREAEAYIDRVWGSTPPR